MTQTRDPKTGQLFYDGVAPTYTEGGAGVGQSFSREGSSTQITALASGDIKFTWPEGSRPTVIEVQLIAGAGYVVFDAVDGNGTPDDALASAWLDGASGEAVDSQRKLVPEYLPEETAQAGSSDEIWRQPFTNGLSNMYLRKYATTPTAVLIGGS